MVIRKKPNLAPWVTVSLLLLSSACGLFLDPDDLVSGNGAVASPEAGLLDGAVVDPNCKATDPEICGDGIDNDCNGGVDCADPACSAAGFVCVDGPPDGWSAVVLATSARPACPVGFSASDVRVVEGEGTFACSCACSGGCAATSTVAFGADNTCAAGSESLSSETNGACQTKSFTIDDFAKITTPSGTCTSRTTTSNNPTNGRLCVTAATVAGGCSEGRSCVPQPNGFEACVMRPGANACPAAYPTKRRVGSDVDDKRTCVGCTCGAAVCSTEIEIWGQPNCNGGSEAVLKSATHSSCASVGTNQSNVKSYKSKTSGGCTVSTRPIAEGSVGFVDERTICCR